MSNQNTRSTKSIKTPVKPSSKKSSKASAKASAKLVVRKKVQAGIVAARVAKAVEAPKVPTLGEYIATAMKNSNIDSAVSPTIQRTSGETVSVVNFEFGIALEPITNFNTESLKLNVAAKAA